MSAPLGGDRLTLDITAEDRAELEVTTAAATLALRGPTTDAATYDVRLTVGEHARLRWLPQPLISAAGSNLHQTYTVELAATSRLVLREEQLLGRHGGTTGHLVTRILVHRPDANYSSTSTRPTGARHRLGRPRRPGRAPRRRTRLLAVYPSVDADQTPYSSVKASRRVAPSSPRWPAGQHCSPPPSHRHRPTCAASSTRARSPHVLIAQA